MDEGKTKMDKSQVDGYVQGMESLLQRLQIGVVRATLESEKSWCVENYSQPFSWLYLVTSGRPSVTFSGRKLRLRKRWINLVPLNVLSHYRCAGAIAVHAVALTCRLSGSLDLFDLVNPPREVSAEDPVATAEMFVRIRALAKPANAAEILERDSLCRALVSRFLLRVPPEGPAVAWQRFAPVLDHIDQYLNERIQLTDLARLMHWHPTHFANEFSKTLGISPRRYINQKRMEHAQTLLDTTSFRIQEIAAMVGIQDPYYFSRLFRLVVGLSPKAYRESAMRRSAALGHTEAGIA